MRKFKIFIVCFCYSFLLVFVMNKLISMFLFDGGYALEPKVFVFNWGLAFLLCSFFPLLLGEGLGGFVLFLLSCVFVIGNIIKLVFHNSILHPADFALMEELFEIGTRFIKPWHIALGLFLAIILIFVVFKLRRVILRGLVPRPQIVCACVFLIVIIGCNFIIDDSGEELDDKTRLETEGLAVFNYINFRDMFKMYPEAPEGYSPELMAELEGEFEGLSAGKETDDIKPDVVVVMMESYFDIGSVEGFGLTQDVTKAARKYTVGNMISPKYGGGTASTEFEALTGFSSAFLPAGIIPYNIYMKGGNKEVPSVVREFNKNGYETTAIHPSTASCYNRDKAYCELGFDRFLTIADFDVDKSEMTEDNMTKDFKVIDKIFEVLEEAEEPEFIFAVTFESHCPYYEKYKEDDIDFEAKGAALSEGNKKEILQYARCAYDASNMASEICEYAAMRSRPTVVICFGDHLPPLGGFSKIGYLDNLYQKYSTPIMVYSNYKKTEALEESSISPSYLAAYMLKEAGIEHSAYFDFISEIMKSEPILNRDFGIASEDEGIKKYKLLQYDLFFGKKYLVK